MFDDLLSLSLRGAFAVGFVLITLQATGLLR